MGKMQSAGAQRRQNALPERLARFVRLQPENALANYYYAVSLLKRRKGPEDTQTAAQVESLLEKAVRARSQARRRAICNWEFSIRTGRIFRGRLSSYQNAIDGQSGVGSRLTIAWRRLTGGRGKKLKAQQELELYQQIIEEKRGRSQERQRHEIQQFVYTLRDATCCIAVAGVKAFNRKGRKGYRKVRQEVLCDLGVLCG